MPFRSFLLRVLVCLSLVLNGVATAAVSVHMPAVAQQAPESPRASSEMPCHDHADKAVAADPVPSGGTKQAPRDHAGSDCCDSGFCRCACMHAAQAALPVLPAVATVTGRDHGVRVLQLGHAAPALPHLIRPPIG